MAEFLSVTFSAIADLVISRKWVRFVSQSGREIETPKVCCMPRSGRRSSEDRWSLAVRF